MAKDKKTDKDERTPEKASATKAVTADVASKVAEFREFFEESKVELKKVTWPTRKEVLVTCAAVAILVVVLSSFLGLVDYTLAKIMESILA